MRRITCGWSLVVAALVLLVPRPAWAHCDGLDGPVVKAAQRALETRNLAFALIWVQEDDEAEIRASFDQTLAVRGLGPQARALADRYFFETLVRVHRAREGAPFTGLKPAGRDLGPAIPAADKAVDSGSVDEVVKLLVGTLEDRLREHFTHLMASRSDRKDDVAAGRAYVKAYVDFIHYVERAYEALTTTAHGHFETSGPVTVIRR